MIISCLNEKFTNSLSLLYVCTFLDISKLNETENENQFRHYSGWLDRILTRNLKMHPLRKKTQIQYELFQNPDPNEYPDPPHCFTLEMRGLAYSTYIRW